MALRPWPWFCQYVTLLQPPHCHILHKRTFYIRYNVMKIIWDSIFFLKRKRMKWGCWFSSDSGFESLVWPPQQMNRRHFFLRTPSLGNCSTSEAWLIFLLLIFQRRSRHDHWLSINYKCCTGAWLFQRAASRLNYPPPRGGKTFWFFRRLSNTHSDFNVSLSGAASAWPANLKHGEKITGQNPRPQRATTMNSDAAKRLDRLNILPWIWLK